MTKKINYVSGEFNCAETLINAFNKNFDEKIPICLGSGMGSGATVGSICGAINAAILIIGMKFGRNSLEEKNNARPITNELLKKIRLKYSSEICANLKKSGISCSEIIEYTYEQLEIILNNK